MGWLAGLTGHCPVTHTALGSSPAFGLPRPGWCAKVSRGQQRGCALGWDAAFRQGARGRPTAEARKNTQEKGREEQEQKAK